MFDTGRRSMESVLLEHCGHDVELYEFVEEGREGVVLWCGTCNENIIKHFLTEQTPAWDTAEPVEPVRQTQNVSAPLWDVGESDTWET